MDHDHTTTTCQVRVAGQQWRNSEVSLGARSLLVRAVDGSAPVEWLPYDDVVNVAEVDDPAIGERFIEIAARDGRRLSMQLDPQMLTSLLAALSGERAAETAPRPAEFEIGPATAPQAMFSTTPPTQTAEASPSWAPAEPSTTQDAGSTEPVGTRSRRTWMLMGAILLVVVLAVIGLFLLLGGDGNGSDGDPAPPTTDAPDIDATPEPDGETETTTTVPTTLPDAGPTSALTVAVEDVTVEAGSDGPAVYLAFATTNETTRDISAYDLEVRLSTTGAQDQEASWSAQFRCAAPLAAEAVRTGSFAGQTPGTDLDAIVDCRVAGWPLDIEDPSESAVAEAIASGASWNAEVSVLSVEFSDGTVLE